VVQSLAVDCEWPSLPDYPLMSLRAANGETIYTYGIYNLKLLYNDSSGSQTESNHRFIVYDFEIPGVTMILGIL
jgi:hypothetical protein